MLSNSTLDNLGSVGGRVARIVLLLTLAAGCQQKSPAVGESAGPSAKEIERRMLRISEAALVAKKHSGLAARRWESIAAMLPESMGALKATNAATGFYDGAATKISKATRNYASSTQTAKVEVMDVVETNGLLLAFMLQQSAAEVPRPRPAGTSDEPVTAAVDVGTHPSLVRYTPATHQTVITVAVDQRFLVEVTVQPSTGIDEAVSIARTLPLGAFASVSGVDAPDAPSAAVDHPAVEGTVVGQ